MCPISALFWLSPQSNSFKSAVSKYQLLLCWLNYCKRLILNNRIIKNRRLQRAHTSTMMSLHSEKLFTYSKAVTIISLLWSSEIREWKLRDMYTLYTCVCWCVCVYFLFSLCFFVCFFLCSFLLQYFDTVGWVFWPVKTVSRITYTVLVGT